MSNRQGEVRDGHVCVDSLGMSLCESWYKEVKSGEGKKGMEGEQRDEINSRSQMERDPPTGEIKKSIADSEASKRTGGYIYTKTGEIDRRDP